MLRGNRLRMISGRVQVLFGHSDLLGRVHRLRAQVESMELHLVREMISRGIPV